MPHCGRWTCPGVGQLRRRAQQRLRSLGSGLPNNHGLGRLGPIGGLEDPATRIGRSAALCVKLFLEYIGRVIPSFALATSTQATLNVTAFP